MSHIILRELKIWFLDQLTHPVTLFQKSTWGVFSKFAHFRRSDSRPKISHVTKQKALKVAESMAEKYGGVYDIYKCLYCNGWHVAKRQNGVKILPASTDIAATSHVSGAIDVERILSLNIPDIAAVYGGVRGRTMSSRHQDYAWPIIREAGIRTIIDLREDGVYTRMNDLCKQYGMTYFYYPVDNRCDNIESMVSLLPELCRYIDAGNFYIACAMGLHRTDIALCLYWTFYGADRGMEVPPIRGYRKDQGHSTEKIFRVLNAVYDYMTARDGRPPMTMEAFKERKLMITSSASSSFND